MEAVGKRKILPLLGVKSGPSSSYLVAISTELSRLHTAQFTVSFSKLRPNDPPHVLLIVQDESGITDRRIDYLRII
jgi:hypothetical protein